MNNLISQFSISSRKAVGMVALGLFGAGVAIAQQPGPAAASQPPAVAGSQLLPSEDILDIREPFHVPASFPWLACSAGSIGAIGAGVGFWAFLRRRRERSPYQVALEKLEAARPLMIEGGGEAFSLAVSVVVRAFVEQSLAVRAVHSTTDEFLHDLADDTASPLAPFRDELVEFLRHCDLAKFARWSLTPSQMEALLASAASFVTAIARPGTTAAAPEKA